MYGENIMSLRKKHKMSQKELGDTLGIGVSSISMWESCKREPSLEHLMAMAELFGVSTDFILFGKSDDRKFSKDEAELVDLYTQLPDGHKAEIKGIIKGLLMAGNV